MSSNTMLKPVAGTQEQVRDARTKLAEAWKSLRWVAVTNVGLAFLGVWAFMDREWLHGSLLVAPPVVMLWISAVYFPIGQKIRTVTLRFHIEEEGLCTETSVNGKAAMVKIITKWDEVNGASAEADAVVLHLSDGNALHIPNEAFSSISQRELLLSRAKHRAAH